MMIDIDKEVPIPPQNRSGGPPRKYPFDELGVGESFFVPGKTTRDMPGSMQAAKKRTGWMFISRTIDGGVRIWRIQ